MNKKNKRKQKWHALPVVLALVMMFSVFTLGAFAEASETCDHSYIAELSESTWDVFAISFYGCDCTELYYFEGMSQAYQDGMFDCDGPYWQESEQGTWVSMTLSNGEEENKTFYGYLYTPPVEEPEPPTESMGIVSAIASDVVGSIGVFLGGIGESLVTFFDTVVTTTNAEGKRTLTTFAGWSIAFLGIGFGSMFIRKLMKKAS